MRPILGLDGMWLTNVTMVVADEILRYTRDCELFADAVRTILMDELNPGQRVGITEN